MKHGDSQGQAAKSPSARNESACFRDAIRSSVIGNDLKSERSSQWLERTSVRLLVVRTQGNGYFILSAML